MWIKNHMQMTIRQLLCCSYIWKYLLLLSLFLFFLTHTIISCDLIFLIYCRISSSQNFFFFLFLLFLLLLCDFIMFVDNSYKVVIIKESKFEKNWERKKIKPLYFFQMSLWRWIDKKICRLKRLFSQQKRWKWLKKNYNIIFNNLKLFGFKKIILI